MRLFLQKTPIFLSLVLMGNLALSSDRPPSQGSLKWYAAKAKAEGKRSIFISTPTGIFADVVNLTDALSVYSVVVAVPVAEKITALDNDQLCTWYKLQVLETIKNHPNPDEPPVQIPDALLPLKKNEFVIRLHGGALVIDGVQVLQEYSPLLPLKLGQRYLMFTLPDSSGAYALLQAGTNAVFAVTENDDVVPLSSKKTRFQENVKEHTGNKLELVKGEAQQVLPQQ